MCVLQMKNLFLESLSCVDCVECSDVLVVVEGGDDGDQVRLDDILRHHTEDGPASVLSISWVMVDGSEPGYKIPGSWLRSQHLQSSF